MNIKATLSLRYGIALFLIATILILSNYLSVKQISASSGSGHFIDISGKQSMLSQRIAFLSQGLLLRGHAHDETISNNLKMAIEEMRANHLFLRSDWEKSVTRGETSFYHLLAAGALSDRIEQFLREAQSILDRHVDDEPNSSTKENAAYEMLLRAESSEFLSEIESVVKLYSDSSQRASNELFRIQSFSLIVGLCILLFEIFCIFRPMVSRIVNCIEALHHANEELKVTATSLSDGLRRPIDDSKSLVKVVENSLSSGKVLEASRASRHIYSSMITMEGIVADLLLALDSQRQAVVAFTGIGKGKEVN